MKDVAPYRGTQPVRSAQPLPVIQRPNAMMHTVVAIGLVAMVSISAARPQSSKNIWEQQYKDRAAVDMAAQFENDRRPVYRHRADIIKMLELKPGMTVAEIGAGSGFLSRIASQAIRPSGRVTATELDQKMVTYMNERAKAEGLGNFQAILGSAAEANLKPKSMDAIFVVNTYSFFDKPLEMVRSISGAMKPGGVLLIVDFPSNGSEGVDPQHVIEVAAAAGLAFVDRRDVVPSHFALRFRK